MWPVFGGLEGGVRNPLLTFINKSTSQDVNEAQKLTKAKGKDANKDGSNVGVQGIFYSSQNGIKNHNIYPNPLPYLANESSVDDKLKG